jgi:hypothetical protein
VVIILILEDLSVQSRWEEHDLHLRLTHLAILLLLLLLLLLLESPCGHTSKSLGQVFVHCKSPVRVQAQVFERGEMRKRKATGETSTTKGERWLLITSWKKCQHNTSKQQARSRKPEGSGCHK